MARSRRPQPGLSAVDRESPSGSLGTVVFVDRSPWDCFCQLAVGVRRRGWRAVRVTIADSRRARVQAYVRRWLFDRTIVLRSLSELDHLDSLLRDERVVDLQCIDSLLGPVVAALGGIPSVPLRGRWACRARATDKAVVSSTLRQNGMWVPDQLVEPTADPERVVETLGLPVVVKPRVGSGGAGVEIVTSMERLMAVSAGPAGDRFYERYVSGRALQYACFAGDDRVEAFVTYETLRRKSPVGRVTVLETIDDPQLAAAGEAAVKALELRGFVDVNVIRDDLGCDWVHDVNPRVWGSFLAFRRMGVDFLGCYADWLGCVARSGPQQQARSDESVTVFPAGLGEASTARRARQAGESWHGARPYLEALGPRYVAFEMLVSMIDRVGRFVLRRESLAGASPP